MRTRLILVLVALVLAACTAEEGSDTTTVEDPATTTTTSNRTTTTPTPPPPPEDPTTTTAPAPSTTAPPPADSGTREQPIQFGEPAAVGDFTIHVVDWEPDATQTVLEHNQFNDPPPAGSVYSIVTIELTYTGDETGEPWLDLSWSAVGDSNVAVDAGDCFTYPNSLFDVNEIFPGGTAQGAICFTVPEADTGSLLLILEDFLSFDDTRLFYALS